METGGGNSFNDERSIAPDPKGRIDVVRRSLNEFIAERYSMHPVTTGAILHAIDRLNTNPTALTLKGGLDAIIGGFMFSFGISYARNSRYPRQTMQYFKSKSDLE